MKPAIQWDEVRRRLQRNEESLRETLSESPERIQTVFRQRAIQLAKARSTNRPTSPGLPALVFRLGQERYAIALQELAEVLPFQGCTRVPGASPKLLGVVSLRGELRPVIDLAHVLSGSPSTDSGSVLVLRRQAALKVDAVNELREIDSDELTSPPQGHFIRAVASGTIGLLDVEIMLSTALPPKESPAT
jgi:purine-binding chemotaxis protein CheW